MRYVLSILAVIICVVLAIVIIATHRNPNLPKPIDINTYNYAGTSVSQITTGHLVGDEQRQAYKITVSETERSFYVLTGYNQVVTFSENYPNNPAAYGVFLSALANAGFVHARNTNQPFMFAVCPLGNTFQYILNSPSKTVSSLWGTSCFSRDGNFAGNGILTRQLFALQIPNFNTVTKNLTTLNAVYVTSY